MVIRPSKFVEERLALDEAGRTYSKNLSIDAIYRQRGDAVVGSAGVVRRERSELSTHTRNHYQQRAHEDADALLSEAGVGRNSEEQFYRLNDEDTFYVEFAEDIDVPEDHVGLIFPRENLLRAGVLMHTTYMGPGEETAEALLMLEDRFVLVSEGAEIAEMIVVEPEQA